MRPMTSFGMESAARHHRHAGGEPAVREGAQEGPGRSQGRVIRRLALVGLGLLGGSVRRPRAPWAWPTRSWRWGATASGSSRPGATGWWTASPPISRRGVGDAATSRLLATPVATLAALLPAVWRALPSDAVLTDVGSTKAAIVHEAERPASSGARLRGQPSRGRLGAGRATGCRARTSSGRDRHHHPHRADRLARGQAGGGVLGSPRRAPRHARSADPRPGHRRHQPPAAPGGRRAGGRGGAHGPALLRGGRARLQGHHADRGVGRPHVARDLPGEPRRPRRGSHRLPRRPRSPEDSSRPGTSRDREGRSTDPPRPRGLRASRHPPGAARGEIAGPATGAGGGWRHRERGGAAGHRDHDRRTGRRAVHRGRRVACLGFTLMAPGRSIAGSRGRGRPRCPRGSRAARALDRTSGPRRGACSSTTAT